MEVYILKNKKWKTPSVQRVITIISSRKGMEFSIIGFCDKVTTIQRTHDKDGIRFYPSGS